MENSKTQGMFGRFQEWMTPERSIAFQGLGMGLSQLAAGQPVNMSPAFEAMQERRQAAFARESLQASGVMEQFTPQQRAILAQMPAEAAQRIIAGVMFREPAGPKITDDMAEYEAARAQGFTGSLQDWIIAQRQAGATNIDLGRNGEPLPDAPKDTVWARDDAGNIVYENFTTSDGRVVRRPVSVPIVGGTVDANAEAEAQAAKQRAENATRSGTTVVQDLQRALDLLPEMTGLAGADGVVGANTRLAQSGIAGTVPNRIMQFTESALSNVGLDTLQAMREASPTGGALGQVPIQQQKRLEQVLGSLRLDQNIGDLDANLKRVVNIYLDIMYGSPEERAALVQSGEMDPEQNAQIDSVYYDLPFDEFGNPVGGNDGDAPPVDFSGMSLDELAAIDTSGMSGAELDALIEALEGQMQ